MLGPDGAISGADTLTGAQSQRNSLVKLDVCAAGQFCNQRLDRPAAGFISIIRRSSATEHPEWRRPTKVPEARPNDQGMQQSREHQSSIHHHENSAVQPFVSIWMNYFHSNRRHGKMDQKPIKANAI